MKEQTVYCIFYPHGDGTYGLCAVELSPEAANFKGLHTDTNIADYRNHGPIQQTPDAKNIATQMARLALEVTSHD